MASGTVGVHLDRESIARLRSMAAVENRSPSQIQAVALKLLLDMSPGTRRALFAIDGTADEAERIFAAKVVLSLAPTIASSTIVIGKSIIRTRMSTSTRKRQSTPRLSA